MSKPVCLLLLSSLLCAISGFVQAAPPGMRPVSPCDAAVTAAEYAYRLPPRMLGAIARVESGRPDAVTGRLQPWPWTINAEGVGAFFATKADAIAAVQALQARGVRSIDVGCTQINLLFHPDAFATLDSAFDPYANATYAARFLDQLHAGSHDWMSAIAAYHSQTAMIGADYRRRVLALWQNPDLAGWGVGLAVTYRDFAPRDQVYGDFAPRDQVYGAFARPGTVGRR